MKLVGVGHIEGRLINGMKASLTPIEIIKSQNIVESGIKYHNPPPRLLLFSSKL
jgi:hypothetical protein